MAHCPRFVGVIVSFTRLPLETGNDDRAAGIELRWGFYFITSNLSFFNLILEYVIHSHDL